MKFNDLLNDTLDDALPPGAAARSLAAMKLESRRLRNRRRVMASSGVAALAILCGWWAIPPRRDPPPQAISSKPSQPQVQLPATRMLTDAELVSRLEQAGLGTAIAGSDETRQWFLISRDGGIIEP